MIIAQFVVIVRMLADHPPCQPTIAAQLLLDGGKIEPYTIRNCWTEMLARSLCHIIILVHFRSKR
jgi:hypothetical protein